VRMAALTRYRSTSPPLRNQKRTIKPDIPNKRTHVLANATNTTNRTRQPKKTKQRKHKKKKRSKDGGGTHRTFRLAHHSVKIKNAARTMLATLLALVSNPHAMSAAPIRPEPRYPAGKVSQEIPPDMVVAPPSSAVHAYAF